MMEYKNELGHLNARELAAFLGIDMEVLLRAVVQEECIRLKDLPMIITYGDLLQVEKVLHEASRNLVEIGERVQDLESLGKIVETAKELTSLFDYVDGVLVEGNIDKRMVELLEPNLN